MGARCPKSYGNSILLSEEAGKLREKIRDSVTDRPKLTDKGNPDRCPVGNLHQIFSGPERLAYITHGCTQATIRCVDCKALAVESTEAHIAPIRERRKHFASQPDEVLRVIRQGAQEATEAAEETMRSVRKAVNLFDIATTDLTRSTSFQKYSSQNLVTQFEPVVELLVNGSSKERSPLRT